MSLRVLPFNAFILLHSETPQRAVSTFCPKTNGGNPSYPQRPTPHPLTLPHPVIALIQRVSEASVAVDGETVGAIGAGLLVLLGVHQADTEAEAGWLAGKVSRLRVFRDGEGRMNRSLLDTDGEALVVSQFTLYGDTRKGNRPSYVAAAPPEKAEALYAYFAEQLSSLLEKPVPTGVFGAMMDVRLVNDGPVTLWIEK